jgi:hypothetical protein
VYKTILIACLMFAASARADEGLPRYDVAALCTAASGALGNSAFAKSACQEQEQESYDRLKARWAGLPDEVRTTCQKISAWTGSGSYFVLGACVDVELDARSRAATSFRY